MKAENRVKRSNSTFSSFFLFPFVFWVSLLVSVLVRILLWYSFVPSSYLGKYVRISEQITKIETRKTSSISKDIIFTRNFRIETTGIERNTEENLYHLIGQRIEAIGILSYRLPEKKMNDFVLRDAMILISHRPLPFLEKLYRAFFPLAEKVHHHFVKTLGNYFFQTERSLFVGMLLGTTEELSSPLYQQLQHSGLLHLVAASGYNVTIVLTTFSLFVGNILPIPFSTISIFFFLFLYTIIAGGQASVVRAALMGGIAYGASQFFGSTAAAKRVFALVALSMLLFFPSWAFDLGYQLSVAATVGLLWLAGPISQIRLIGQIRPIGESLAVFLTTAPVLAASLGWDRVTWAGIVTTPVAQLLVGPIMILGAGTVLVGSIWPFGGMIIAVLGKPVIAGLLKVIEVGATISQK